MSGPAHGRHGSSRQPARSADVPPSAAESDIGDPEPAGSSASIRRVAILGVGLLGGSVAMALRRRRPDLEIVGWARGGDKRQRAVQSGVVDRAVENAAAACEGCDVVVVATPVDRVAELVIEAAAATPTGCLITDVGSTKASIVEAVGQDPLAGEKFVAAHPIAGSEKAGLENASPTLFDGRLVVITPAPAADPERTLRAARFWQTTGAETLVLTADRHDTLLATTSHVPHLVSAAVARLVTPESRPLVGTGWLDTTRIAAGDPRLWTAIVAENRSAIASVLQQFRDEVDTLLGHVTQGRDDDVCRWLGEAKRARDEASP